MPEADLQAGIEDALAAGGWLYHHDEQALMRSGSIATSYSGQTGWPDIVAVHHERGLLVVLELKSHRGQLTAEQWRWLHAFEAAGIDVRKVKPADYDDLVDFLLGDRLIGRHRRPVGAGA